MIFLGLEPNQKQMSKNVMHVSPLALGFSKLEHWNFERVMGLVGYNKKSYIYEEMCT